MLTIILSGGIGAGKTQLTKRLLDRYNFVEASPATVMKESIAKAIALEYGDGSLWTKFFAEMMSGETKEEYRLLLQGYGEWFSNRDFSYWADKAADSALWAAANLPDCQGIVGDSIRRSSEILALKRHDPARSFHIRLEISPERQMQYLTEVRGMGVEQARATLAHSSEHWLDDIEGTPCAPDAYILVTSDDENTWVLLMSALSSLGWDFTFNHVVRRTSDYA